MEILMILAGEYSRGYKLTAVCTLVHPSKGVASVQASQVHVFLTNTSSIMLLTLFCADFM